MILTPPSPVTNCRTFSDPLPSSVTYFMDGPLLAGILLPCIDSGWPSCASFLFWWQTRSSSCKHLDSAAPCILCCCSFYLEFTSLADSIVTKELHAFALKLLKTNLFQLNWTGSASE